MENWVTAVAASPSGDTVYVGSVTDYRPEAGLIFYALNTSDGTMLWQFIMDDSDSSVTAVAASLSGDTVYVGSDTGNIYAVNASIGAKLWQLNLRAVIAASIPFEDLVSIGLRDGTIWTLRSQGLSKLEETDWGLVGFAISAFCGILTVFVSGWWQWTSESVATSWEYAPALLFWPMGSAFGLWIGLLMALTLVVLQQKVAGEFNCWTLFTMSVLRQHMDGVDVNPWAGFSITLLLFMLVMALIWGLSASFDGQLVRLAEFSSLVVLISGLLVGFNMVPGLWAAFMWVRDVQHPDWVRDVRHPGSQPKCFVAWMACSYPAGLLTVVFGLAILEALFVVLEHGGERTWRGHFFRRFVILFPAYNWGFFFFWVSTATTTFLFNKADRLVPPFSTLCWLGVAVGLIAFRWRILTSALPDRDPHVWVLQRAWDIKHFVTWWPGARSRSVRVAWDKRTQHVRFSFSLRRWVALYWGAFLPASCRNLRCSLRLTPLGLDWDMKDELDWALLYFAGTSLLAVAPLIAVWFSQRFSPRARLLVLNTTFELFGGPNLLPTTTTELPFRLFVTDKPSFFPLVYDVNAIPVRSCQSDNVKDFPLDIGDYNACVNGSYQGGMTKDAVQSLANDTCRCLYPSIQAEPSKSVFFNLQLVVYVGFFLLYLWVVAKEANEKLRVLVALGREAKYRASRGYLYWVRTVAVPVTLAFCLSVCLHKDQVKESFWIMGQAGSQDMVFPYVNVDLLSMVQASKRVDGVY